LDGINKGRGCGGSGSGGCYIIDTSSDPLSNVSDFDVSDNNDSLTLLVSVLVLKRLCESRGGHQGAESKDGTHVGG